MLQSIEPPLKDQANLGIAQKLQNTAVVTTTLGPWLLTHREAIVRPKIDGFINSIRLTPGVDKIGTVGFCWGGRYAILQSHGGTVHSDGSSIGGVDAAVAFHPSLLAIPADLEGVKKPLSIGLGEHDSQVPKEQQGKILEVLGTKSDVVHELRIFEGQVHGFALRGDWSSAADGKAMDEAETQGIEWLQKYLA